MYTYLANNLLLLGLGLDGKVERARERPRFVLCCDERERKEGERNERKRNGKRNVPLKIRKNYEKNTLSDEV